MCTDEVNLEVYKRVLFYLCALFAVALQSKLLFTLISWCYTASSRLIQGIPYLIFVVNGLIPLVCAIYTGIALSISDPSWRSEENQVFIGHMVAYVTLSSLISLVILNEHVKEEERQKTEK